LGRHNSTLGQESTESIDPSTPQFRAAQQTCQKLGPGDPFVAPEGRPILVSLHLRGWVGRIGGLAFSFLYLPYRALLGALVRSRTRTPALHDTRHLEALAAYRIDEGKHTKSSPARPAP